MVEPSGGRSEVEELRDVKRARFGEGSMQERNIGAASRARYDGKPLLDHLVAFWALTTSCIGSVRQRALRVGDGADRSKLIHGRVRKGTIVSQRSSGVP